MRGVFRADGVGCRVGVGVHGRNGAKDRTLQRLSVVVGEGASDLGEELVDLERLVEDG